MMKLLYRTLFLLFLLPTVALAQLPNRLLEDFAPADGIVLMAIGDSWLVDLDANQNLRPGDILSVMAPGETIIHPQTRDIIGRIDHVIGFLEVSRVMSGYSYADLLTAGLSLQAGDQVRRFEQVPAYVDASVPQSLAQDLKKGLPHLQWTGDQEEDTISGIEFRVDFERLIVSGADGKNLYTYRFSSDQVVALTATAAAKPVPQIQPIESDSEEEGGFLQWGFKTARDSVGLGFGDRRLENPGIIRGHQTGAFWVSPPLSGSPVAMATGDVTGDGHKEIILAFRDELQILRLINREIIELDRLTFPVGTQLLSVDTYDSTSAGYDNIFLTTITGRSVNSRVLSFKSGRLETLFSNIDLFLRVTQLAGEGRVLLGQRINYIDNSFRSPVFRVHNTATGLTLGEELKLPLGVNIYNFIGLRGSRNADFLVSLSDADYLHLLDAEGGVLWSSVERFGGTDADFTVLSQREAQERGSQFVQKRLLPLPSAEILVIQNEGQRLLSGLRLFTSGRIVAFGRDGDDLRELWATPSQQGYMADFVVADIDSTGEDVLLIAMRFQEKNILQRGHSALLVFKLQQ